MEYIGIFNSNPTAGGTDGAEVSRNGVYSNPVEATVDINGSGSVVACAVRCATGYCVDGDVTLRTMTYESGSYSAGSDYIKLSNTANGTFSDSIDISNVEDTNVLFYAKILPGATLGNHTAAISLEATVIAQ